MSLWPFVALACLWRFDGLAHKWLALRFPAPPKDALTGPIVIPDDLDAVALQESELHAQESVREACREAFERYKDWNKVRTALGVGTRD